MPRGRPSSPHTRVDLRQRVGMVFQKPNPFPQTIFDNVAFGPRVLGRARPRAPREGEDPRGRAPGFSPSIP